MIRPLAIGLMLLAPACKQHEGPERNESQTKQITVSRGPELPRYAAGEITELDIEHGDQRVGFRRRADGTWLMVRPMEAPADPRALQGALRELSRMEGEGRPASLRPQDWGRYHVGADQVVTIRPRAGAKELPVLHLGRKTWVRVGDSPAVFTAWHINYYTFARSEIRLWRDRTVTDFAPGSVTAFEARYPKGVTIAARRTGRGAWTLTRGADRIGKVDGDAVDSLVARLGNLVAHDAAGVATVAAGLERPRLTLVFARKELRDTVELGAAEGGFVYLRSSRSPQIWLVKEQVVASLLRGPQVFGKK